MSTPTPRRRSESDAAPGTAGRPNAGYRAEYSGAARPALRALRALRVPEITVYFWLIKALSTAMGESTSDYLVHTLHPVPAVLLGFCRLPGRPGAAVLDAPLSGLDLLVRGRHGGRLRHDGRRCAPRRLRRPLLRLGGPVGGRSCRRLCDLAGKRAHAFDPQHRQAATRGLLLGRGRGHLRLGHRRRRSHRLHLPPGLLPLDRALRRGDRDPRRSATGGSTGTRSSPSGLPTSSPGRWARRVPTGWASPSAWAVSAGARRGSV